MTRAIRGLAPYPKSLAGTLLAAREAVMAPIRPILRAADVTEQQWRVLRVLAGSESLDVSSIATFALLHPPSVTRILRELGDRGLIERSIDSRDSRRSIVAITPAGIALIDDTGQYTVQILQAYEDAFGSDRLKALQAELVDFTRAIAGIASPGPADASPSEA